MAETYTRDQCISWLIHPDMDPVTHHSLLGQKKTFQRIIIACRQALQNEDVVQHNPNLLQIIFPNTILPLVGDQEIVSHLKNPSLIQRLLKSEQAWLTKKAVAYQHLLKIHGSNETMLQSLAQIHQRLKQLAQETDNCITMKQVQLLDCQSQIANTCLWLEVRSILYQMILDFAGTSQINLNCCIVGQPGTSRSTVVMLLANLYHSLGLLNSPSVTYGFSLDHLETLIIVSTKQLHLDYLSMARQLYGICIFDDANIEDANVEDAVIEDANIPPPIKQYFPHTIHLPTPEREDRDHDGLGKLFDNVLRSRLSYQHAKI